jgi:hypothetical protein
MTRVRAITRAPIPIISGRLYRREGAESGTAAMEFRRGSVTAVFSDLMEFVMLFMEFTALSCIFFDTFAATFAILFTAELGFVAFRRTVLVALPDPFPSTVLRAFVEADAVFPITVLIAFAPLVAAFPRTVLIVLVLVVDIPSISKNEIKAL